MMNGYNFTERVRRTLAHAREEANELNHEYVGTEHILLGIIREQEGVAITVLTNLNVDLDRIHEIILQTVKRGGPGPMRSDLPYTSRAKKVLELAMSEARDLNHSYVGTEHALLGLLREEKGIAAQVLHDAGVTLDAARSETKRILGTVEPESNKPRAVSVNTHLPQSARRVRQIIAAAHDVAELRKSPVLEPAHVVMALLAHSGGMANAALDRLGLDRDAVMGALNDISPPGAEPLDPEAVLRPTPSLVTAVVAMEEVQRETRAPRAASHHLLLALMHTCVEIDAVFAAQNIGAAEIREQVSYLSG
jgi:ATP-dependent Clp protease ATP-binding subunit ClpA